MRHLRDLLRESRQLLFPHFKLTWWDLVDVLLHILMEDCQVIEPGHLCWFSWISIPVEA